MPTARENLKLAETHLSYDDYNHMRAGQAYALLSIAQTLADMADMDADTRIQPAVKPPAPAPNYQLYHPGDTERIPT